MTGRYYAYRGNEIVFRSDDQLEVQRYCEAHNNHREFVPTECIKNRMSEDDQLIEAVIEALMSEGRTRIQAATLVRTMPQVLEQAKRLEIV